MPNVGPLEIIVVLALVLIIFGPKRLPELGRSLGKGIREFRGSISGDHDDDEPKTLEASAEPVPQPVQTNAEQNAQPNAQPKVERAPGDSSPGS